MIPYNSLVNFDELFQVKKFVTSHMIDKNINDKFILRNLSQLVEGHRYW